MKEVKTFRLTPAQQQVVDEKVKSLNEFLEKCDIDKFFEEEAKRKKAAKS
jgi:hypothetical protein